MSYEAAEQWLRATLKTAPDIKTVVQGEPSSVQRWPLVYTWLDGADRSYATQLVSMSYRVMARLCIPIQENANAEAALASFVNSIPAHLDQTFRTARPYNDLKVTTELADQRNIAGTECRTLDLTITILEKDNFGGSL